MKKHFLFAALFVALSLSFVSCENPDDEPGFSLENVGQDDANSDKYNAEGSTDGDETAPSAPEEPMLVATGGATDVEYSSVTLWGRLNTDTLVFFPKVKWGVECSASKEEITTHSGKKKLCTTDLVGENADEFSVELTEVGYGKMLYYNAYLLINDIKYVYGEVDSVHMDVKLTLKPNNSDYGTVTGTVYHDYGSETTITATPKENYYFTGWSDSDSKELSRTITIISDTTITAIFSEEPYLTAKPNNSDYGTVTGSGYYDVGAEATITATPKENYYFTGWSDSDSKELSRTITIISDATITANFAKKPYLTVKTNNNYGTVTGSGYYEVGSEATITATPNYDYIEFVQWSDGNTENPRTITVTSDVTYTATFKVNLPGSFSVSNTTQVYFSSGNLQYHPKKDQWRFAPSQLDYIGSGNENISSTYNGWLDLFGWSTSATYFGVSTSTDNLNDYLGRFVDWGSNQIGVDAPNTWRTLTYDEWYYLRWERPNYDKLIGVAEVNGVNGLILLPDSWTCPDGITFKSGFHNGYAAYQTFTADQWQQMEAAGAVFLPAAGDRYGSDVFNVQGGGDYWSATEYDGGCAYYLYFYSGEARMYLDFRYYGPSVRLVKDL